MIVLSLLITGCTSNSELVEVTSELSQAKEDLTQLTKENGNLKKEIDALKNQLDDLQNGPDVLLAKAQQFFDNRDIKGIEETLTLLTDKHPASNDQISAIEKLNVTLSETLEKEKEQAKKEAADKQVAEEKRLAEATKKMRTNFDEVKEITWYHDKTTTDYVDENSFAIYIGKEKTGEPWLRIRLQYAGDDWVFVDSYIIKADDTTFNINPSYGEIKRDHDYGVVWEYYDGPVTDEIYNMIIAIMDSKKTIIRHQGDEYRFDWTVKEAEKKAIRNVLDAYEALGGKRFIANAT